MGRPRVMTVEFLTELLARHNGDYRLAADEIGMKHNTFYLRLRRAGLFRSLTRLTREEIVTLLETHGSYAAAAKAAGLSLEALYQRARRKGIRGRGVLERPPEVIEDTRPTWMLVAGLLEALRVEMYINGVLERKVTELARYAGAPEEPSRLGEQQRERFEERVLRYRVAMMREADDEPRSVEDLR